MTWIQTTSGRKFDVLKPIPEMVDLDDIALSLSRICRFGGHGEKFYSVAEHSVLVAHICRIRGAGAKLQRVALLHDATEAYLGDVCKPIKEQLPDYQKLEKRVWKAICKKFFGEFIDFDDPRYKMVKEADSQLLHLEGLSIFRKNLWARDALCPEEEERIHIHFMRPEQACACFHIHYGMIKRELDGKTKRFKKR